MTVPDGAAVPVNENECNDLCDAVGRGVFPLVNKRVSVQTYTGCLAVCSSVSLDFSLSLLKSNFTSLFILLQSQFYVCFLKVLELGYLTLPCANTLSSRENTVLEGILIFL